LRRWFGFNSRLSAPSEELVCRRKLVRFLFGNRGGDTPLREWLDAIDDAIVGEVLRAERQLQEDAAVFAKLKVASAKDGAIGRWSVGMFGGQGGSPNNLNLITLHSSKGLEFDVVFMLGMDEGIEPPFWIQAEEGVNERRRLFFVGFTRARNEVHMMCSGWTLTKRGNRRNDGPSRFLRELSQRLKEGQ